MDLKKTTFIALLVLVAVISFTKVAPLAADPANHKHSIEMTEEKITKVMALSGGAAVTSATLSLLPGDMCTPIANQLAELAKYFLLILSALYLEKFLISLSGYITFGLLVPVACALLGFFVVTGSRNYSRISAKILLTGVIIFFIVPASVWLSDKVYQSQAEKIDSAIEEINDLDIESETGGGFLNEITSLTSKTVDGITSSIDHLLESLAVMIVTSCVIPILVFVFLFWLVKIIFSANILMLDPASVKALAGKG